MGEQKSFLFKNPNHLVDLNDMRLSGQLCDVTIKVHDREFRAHKNILAASLKYFKSMFLSPFQESKQNVITMQNVEREDLEILISFAYTGEILLTDSNALGLLETTNYLNEDVIKEACIKFLVKNLKNEDACRAYKLANAIECLSLKKASKSTILTNFDFCSQTTEYFDFDYESLKDILSGADVASVEERKLSFESVMRWVLHDVKGRLIFIDNLLEIIEITKLNGDYLLEYLCNYIGNQNYEDFVKNIMFFYRKKRQEMKDLKRILMVMGIADEKLQVQFFNFSEKKWSQAHEIVNSNNLKIGKSSILNDKCYYVSFNDTALGNLQVFNPATKEHVVLLRDQRILKGSAVCACDRFLYLCGGMRKDDSISNQVVKYDPRTNSFETLPPMQTERQDAAAIFYQGYLHVLGGWDGFRLFNSVEKYDPVRKQWTTFPSMSEARFFHAVAVLGEKLYACEGALKFSVEVYDPSKNSWQAVAFMNESRSDFFVIPHKGKLFAIGDDKKKIVEIYEPNKNKWQIDQELFSEMHLEFPFGGLISSNSAN